jgi:DNA-binding transcriptional LysR family regulator
MERRRRAFVAVAEVEGFRAAAKMLNTPATNISSAVRRLEGALGIELFIGAGKGKKLNANGVALWQLIRSSSPADRSIEAVAGMAAGEVRALIERASPPAIEDAVITPSDGADAKAKSRRLRIGLPQHPYLSHLLRAGILAAQDAPASLEMVQGGEWTNVVADIFDGKFDVGFCWSAGRTPTGYADFVQAVRLAPDKFDHLLTYRTYIPTFGRRLAGARLIKTPIAIPAVPGQPGLRAALEKGLQRFGLTIHPNVGELPRGGGILTAERAAIPQKGHRLVPLGPINVEGGLDVVYRVELGGLPLARALEIFRNAFSDEAERTRPKSVLETRRRQWHPDAN